MKKIHVIKNIHFRDDSIVLSIDGVERRFSLKEISSLLFKASDQERINFEISPSGYGIHWPLLDEDLSIDGILIEFSSGPLLPPQDYKHSPEEIAGKNLSPEQ